MTDLFIIGTGGAAKEIIQLIEQINAVKPSFDIKGFIDLNIKSDNIIFFKKSFSLINESQFITSQQGAYVVIAHGMANMRSQIFNKYIEFNFPNLIHPLVDIHKSVRIGKGNIIKMGCLFTTDINIGNNNYINRGVQLGHDVFVGNNNVINPGAIISGGVELRDQNNIGANATILQYLKIGNNNSIGAGAVLTKNAADNEVLVGIPAKAKIN